MTRDEASIERMARAFAAELLRGSPNPEMTTEKYWPAWLGEMEAVFAALLADPPPAIERAVLERLIAEQRRECARLRQDDPYFVPHIKARIDFLSDRLAELDAEEKRDAR